jgi:acyl-CoA dehydrogenase
MKMMEAESSEKKLKSAVRTGKIKGAYDSSLMEKAVQQGVITKEEADLINTAEDARRDVIMVDDFPKEYWGKPNP